jgi:type II secretory pathway component PulF
MVDAAGKVYSSVAEALDEQALERDMATRGCQLISTEEITVHRASANGKHVSPMLLENFSELLSALLVAGLTLRDALDLLSRTAEQRKTRSIAGSTLSSIESGASLETALRGLGYSFPPLLLGLVRIGERTGDLGPTFKRLVDHLGTERRFREKLIGAMIYPALVLILVLAGLIGLAVFVLPRLESFLSTMGSGSAALIRGRIVSLVSIAIVGLFVIFMFVTAIPLIRIFKGRYQVFSIAWDGLLLHIPVLGRTLKDRQTMEFSFAMESLLIGGLPLDEALAESAGAISNSAYAHDVSVLREEVVKGASLSDAARNSRALPHYLRQWFAVGERTGRIDSVFSHLRIYYQQRSERMTESAMALIEPLMIAIIGSVLLTLVILIFLPILSAFNTVL